MSTRIVPSLLAIVLLGLPAISGACKNADAPVADAAGGRGGSHTGGTRAAGGQTGTGGVENGGTSGGEGGSARGGSVGTGGTSTSNGGATGKDAAAGGSGGKDAGSGGSGPVDSGPVACDDIDSTGRLAVYFYDDSAVSSSSIQMHFDLVNFTAFSSRLPQVTVRYWFTDEDASSANVVEKYYVPITTTMKFIAVNPPRSDADTVLEMSFPETPDSGASWVETKGFNLAFHKTSYAGTYTQDNDYSYDSKLTKTLGQNPKITAYVNGVLAWGCEPPVATTPLPDADIDGGALPPMDAPAGSDDAQQLDSKAALPDSGG